MSKEANAVTGVSGFSGRYIARRLLAQGKNVINLTGHPEKGTEFGDKVESKEFNFDNPDELKKTLSGVDVLFNTYWVRFSYCNTTFDKAIENSITLINAAKEAGVRRIVYVSITNPSEDSVLPYFRGKAIVEKEIKRSGLSYAILRPTVLFGDQGILINNIAWFLRHLPVFGIPGSGEYKLQPIFVDDLAGLAVDIAQKDEEDVVIDAVGPEIFTFNDLVRLIKEDVNGRALVVNVNSSLSLIATTIIGRIINDVILTKDEIKGLEANLLVSAQPPTGSTSLSRWLKDNSNWLGTRYFSEIKKHFCK